MRNIIDRLLSRGTIPAVGPAGSLGLLILRVWVGLTVFAELFCSLAPVFGFITRGSAIPLIIAMLTAALVIHGDDPRGKKELALLYLAPYVTLLFAGPGKYSLDRIISRRADEIR